MADNVTADAGSGGATFAADDVAGVHYPRTKIALGGDGTASGDMASGAGAVGDTVPRVTLASDDPAVALLTTMDADTGNAATALQIMDDWDESDRAKVNLIAGQAGIAAGAGAVGVTVPRVTLASDDPGVAHMATIAGDTTSLDGKVTACNTDAVVISSGTVTAVTEITNALPAGANAIGKLAANSGVDIGDVDILSIAAGDNNIGNVDIVSLPAGNIGMQLMAASVSVVPASNITDETYIGDIKFGEALPAGTNAIGKLAANSGVDIGDVDVLSLPALAAGTNLVGKVGIDQTTPGTTNAVAANVVTKTTGGCSFFKSIDLDETEEEVKGAAGTLYGGIVVNLSATIKFLKVYNAAAADVTVGTTVPDLTIPIPSPGDTTGGGFTLPIPPQGIAFSTAITVAATTGIADNDAGAPGANEVAVTLFYA